jgi:hypothetical protein
MTRHSSRRPRHEMAVCFFERDCESGEPRRRGNPDSRRCVLALRSSRSSSSSLAPYARLRASSSEGWDLRGDRSDPRDSPTTISRQYGNLTEEYQSRQDVLIRKIHGTNLTPATLSRSPLKPYQCWCTRDRHFRTARTFDRNRSNCFRPTANSAETSPGRRSYRFASNSKPPARGPGTERCVRKLSRSFESPGLRGRRQSHSCETPRLR